MKSTPSKKLHISMAYKYGAKFTIKEFSSIDVLINNAGVYGPIGPIDTVSWDEWVYALNINLIGSILMIRSLIPTLKAQKKSKIIQSNTISIIRDSPFIHYLF